MKLTQNQILKLQELMINSAQKGNLANSGCVFERGEIIAFDESLVISNHDATAHSERMLVEKVCKLKGSNYTGGLKMLTIVEPCLMCMSACSQAGYSEIAYIIPAKKYVEKIPWMTDVNETVDKHAIASNFSEPMKLTYLQEYEQEFSEVFENVMAEKLQ